MAHNSSTDLSVEKASTPDRVLAAGPGVPLDALLDSAIANKLCTGAAGAVSIDGKIVWSRCAGKTALESDEAQLARTRATSVSEFSISEPPVLEPAVSPPAPITTQTLFDAASLTKPLATALLVMKAVESGALDLDAPLGKYLPEIHSQAAHIPLIALLTHTGGMPAIPALERFFPDSARLDRQEALAQLFSIRPEFAAGRHVEYSCTGYILVGAVLERISGMLLGTLFEQEIARPLALSCAAFAPRILDSGEPSAFEGAAQTEFCPWRKKRMDGQVHDESAYCLGGHSGNAGLFLSLEDALVLGNLFLQEGISRGKQLLRPETMRTMLQERTIGLEERRSIAFKLHGQDTADGPLWPAQSFGHTGFTGTSIFFEPGRKLVAVLLTNRVYYGREATAGLIVAFRKEFHSGVWRAFC